MHSHNNTLVSQQGQNRGPALPTPDPTTFEGNFAEPFFKTAFQEAFRQYNQGGPQFFGGPTVAGFSPQQLESQRQLQGQVSPQLQQLGQMQLGGLQRQFDIGTGQAGLSPISQELQASITNPILRGLEQQQSQIGSGATQLGAFGGSRQQLLENQAALGAGQRLQDSLAQATLQQRQQELGALQGAQQQAGQVRQGLTAAPSILAGVGAQGQQMNQQLIDSARQRFQFGQTSQQRGLNQLLQQLSGMPAGLTQDKAVPASGTSQFLSLLTGLGGLGLFS